MFGPGYRADHAFRSAVVSARLATAARGGRIADAPGYCVVSDDPVGLAAAEKAARRLIRRRRIVAWGPFGAIPIAADEPIAPTSGVFAVEVPRLDPRLFLEPADLVRHHVPLAESIVVDVDDRRNGERYMAAHVRTRAVYPGETEGFVFFGIAPVLDADCVSEDDSFPEAGCSDSVRSAIPPGPAGTT